MVIIDMNNIDEILKKIFPEIHSLRDIQKESIQNILDGNNLLCLMPTGEGKSLIYQIAGICLKKTTLVISPLIALMKQQSEQLRKKGLKCLFFSEYYDTKKQHKVMKDLLSEEKPDFIFLSPERAAYEGYLEYVLKRNNNIGLIIIDEAHCVSQWGYNFRPTYKMIPIFLNNVFGEKFWPRILCLTATLSPWDQEEIKKDFRIDKTCKSPNQLRNNLNLKFRLDLNNEDDKNKLMEELFEKHKDEKILVFAHRKKGNTGTRKLCKLFQEKGYDCEYFDADATEKHKADVLENFQSGDLKIVIATSAFGMGIDIPDIRVIIHYLIPESIEQYYQEVGRAGRDGKEAFGYLFYTEGTKRSREKLIRNSIINKNDILDTFNDKLLTGRGLTTGCINVWEDLSEEEKLSFSLLYRHGIITVISKGIKSFDCFKAKTEAGKKLIESYKSFSKTLSVLFIHSKGRQEIFELIQSVYNGYSNGDLNFEKAPIKAVFFEKLKELNEDSLSVIEKNQEMKLKERMKNFNTFIQGIENNLEPTTIVKNYLQI